MRIIMSHGLESRPNSHKIQFLKITLEGLGHEVVVPDYRSCKEDRDKRLELLLSLKPEGCVLVGSSLGGWVSLAAATKVPVLGLFLMAPAVGKTREGTVYPDLFPAVPRIHIVHGLDDTVVPYKNSLSLLRHYVEERPVAEGGLLCKPSLLLLADGHRLGDPGTLRRLNRDLVEFVRSCGLAVKIRQL